MKRFSFACSKSIPAILFGACGLLLLFYPALGKAVSYPTEKEVVQLADQIKGDRLIQHAKIISGGKYQGREAGRAGSRLSAKYIINQFRQIGLRSGGSAGTYLQTFKIQTGYRISSEMQLTVAGKSLGDFIRRRDYSLVHLINKQARIKAGVVFAGYGISRPEIRFDEYNGVDVKGKAVLVFAGVPWDKQTLEWETVSSEEVTQYKGLAYKARNAAARGAACLLIADDPMGWKNDVKADIQLRNPDYNSPVQSTIPIIHISGDTLDEILALSADEVETLALDIAKDREPESHLLRGRHIRLNASVKGKAWVGRNIIGILPGTHPVLKQQTIVIGAHYDHLGEDSDEIFFGANDNAAGVAAVIELARAFSNTSGSKRTLMFVAFDAEEIGKIGSSYFVDHSPIPAEQMVLMINFDMIGKNNPIEINAVATRSSRDLHLIHQKMNQYVGLRLKHPRSYRLGRSDHTYFFYSGVPVMYLFGGLDKDYNTPQDTWDRLIPGKIEKVARLAFLTAWAASDRNQRLTFDSEMDSQP
jgi:hypothetical protein